MEIERHQSFTITLTADEAWNLCAEVDELTTMQDPKDGGAGLNTKSGLLMLREIADTFAQRQYLMPSTRPVDDSRPNVPEEFRVRPQDTRKWTD
jgi:hypothetical protein